MSADRALMAEIDENLMRAELSPAETSMHLVERKRLYLRLHPETKHGGAPGKTGNGKGGKSAKMASLPPAYIDDTATKAGEPKSHAATLIAPAFIDAIAAKSAKSKCQTGTLIAPAISAAYLRRLSKADPAAFMELLGELLPQRTQEEGTRGQQHGHDNARASRSDRSGHYRGS